jgi:hypothetical protein
VAASLDLLRGVADEIVVAVDSRVDPSELGAYHGVADRVLRFELRDPFALPQTWLGSQCAGDWILYLDGDEVPSAALVAGLDPLLDADDVVQYWLPRRWLFRSETTWLGELPWWPDFQLRLARRGSALGFRYGLHGGMLPLLPARHVDAPIYHLDLLVNSAAERERKATRYEAHQPAGAAFGGGPLNETFYLPERHVLAELLPVPDEDVPALRRVLASRVGGAVAGRETPVVPAEEVDALAPGPDPPEAAYALGLEPFDERDRRFAPAESRPVFVWLHNGGTVWWSWGMEQQPELRLSYRWRAPDGKLLVADGVRTPLWSRIAPGDTQLVPIVVVAPDEPGRYQLELELIHEGVRRFPSSLIYDVEVADRPVRR